MGPTWVLSDPDRSHVGPMNLAIRVLLFSKSSPSAKLKCVNSTYHVQGYPEHLKVQSCSSQHNGAIAILHITVGPEPLSYTSCINWWVLADLLPVKHYGEQALFLFYTYAKCHVKMWLNVLSITKTKTKAGYMHYWFSTIFPWLFIFQLFVFVSMTFLIIFFFVPVGKWNDIWKTDTLSYVVWKMFIKIPWLKLVPHLLCVKNNSMCLGLTAWKFWLFLCLLDSSCMFHGYNTSLVSPEGYKMGTRFIA